MNMIITVANAETVTSVRYSIFPPVSVLQGIMIIKLPYVLPAITLACDVLVLPRLSVLNASTRTSGT
jgi:hypothetical protein